MCVGQRGRSCCRGGPGHAGLHGGNAVPVLTGAPYKRYVEIGEGTHTVIMEKNRMSLFREVQLFLDEAGR